MQEMFYLLIWTQIILQVVSFFPVKSNVRLKVATSNKSGSPKNFEDKTFSRLLMKETLLLVHNNQNKMEMHNKLEWIHKVLKVLYISVNFFDDNSKKNCKKFSE